MSCNRELFDKIISIIQREAHDARESAGYNGSMHDGGASRLEEQIRFFEYGLVCTFPPEWEAYKKQIDPEYTEYLRLKRKFG
jgi:hypothetical protein